jgi:hypothetical protein
MFVPLDVIQAAKILLVDDLNQAFGEHDHAVGPSAFKTLDHASDNRIHEALQFHRTLGKFLGNNGQRGPGGLADAECQMSGLSPHRDREIPARRGPRIYHEILQDFDAEMAGGLETEGRNAMRQIQVVVDGFRHMDDLHAALGARFQLQRGEGGIVAPDRDEAGDPETGQRGEDTIQVLRLLGRIRPRRPQMRASAKMNAADFFDRERMHMGGAAFHQPSEPVEKPQHFGAAHDTADRDGADHAVDAGGRPPSDQHADNRTRSTDHE